MAVRFSIEQFYFQLLGMHRHLRVLVTGGRKYSDRRFVFAQLDILQDLYGPLVVIQGGAKGADLFAKQWSLVQVNGSLIDEPADWERYGSAAGLIRNVEMEKLHKPDVVLAFPGGTGTAHMVKVAKYRKVPVLQPAKMDIMKCLI